MRPINYYVGGVSLVFLLCATRGHRAWAQFVNGVGGDFRLFAAIDVLSVG